jgi:hypothetical protein
VPHIVHSEFIESLCDFDLLCRVKEGIRKLLSLSQGALDDLESRDIAQKVADGLVRIPTAWMRILPRFDRGKAFAI